MDFMPELYINTERVLNRCIDECNSILVDEKDKLFVQIMDKNAFDKKLSEINIKFEAQALCRNILFEKEIMPYFLRAYIYKDLVIVYGVTIGDDISEEIPDPVEPYSQSDNKDHY